MGISAVQYKVLPENIDINLDILKEKIKRVIEENKGLVSDVVEQPIAFGLKALIFSFAFPEENDVEQIENFIKGVEGVSSCELIDYRRALG
ncbi:MAG: elongation factor 1-beta [Candidatus Pacearchaeota archaeon]